MKILQISTYYLPHFGGIEQVVYDFCSILTKHGHTTKVICFNDKPKTLVDTYEGQEIIRVGYKCKLASQAISLRYFFELKKIIKKFRPDVIHIHLPNPLIAIYLLIVNPKCKITLHWHSDIIRQKRLKHLYAPFEKALLKRAEKIVATTQVYAENSDRLYRCMNKVRIIPCMIEDAFLDRMSVDEKNMVSKLKELYKNKKIVFSIGVHREYKGLKYLIEASKYLTYDYIVVIAGTGPLTDSLKALANKLLLQNIHFVGRITDEEKKLYLWAAEVYAFPSITKNEAFGIALAEALYCGLPAVTFTIEGSGVNYVNQDGITGIEVHEFDAKLYAQALMSCTKEKYGANARKWAKEHFTRNAISEKVTTFFEIDCMKTFEQ